MEVRRDLEEAVKDHERTLAVRHVCARQFKQIREQGWPTWNIRV